MTRQVLRGPSAVRCAPLQNADLAIVSQGHSVGLGPQRRTSNLHVPPDEAVLDAGPDIPDLAILQDDAMLDFAALDENVVIDGGVGAYVGIDDTAVLAGPRMVLLIT